MRVVLLALLKGGISGSAWARCRRRASGSAAGCSASCVYGVVGALVGIVCGRPIWRQETFWTPLLKGIFGFDRGRRPVLGAHKFSGGMRLDVRDQLGAPDKPAPRGPVRARPARSASLWGAFVELDDSGSGKAARRRRPRPRQARRPRSGAPAAGRWSARSGSSTAPSSRTRRSVVGPRRPRSSKAPSSRSTSSSGGASSAARGDRGLALRAGGCAALAPRSALDEDHRLGEAEQDVGRDEEQEDEGLVDARAAPRRRPQPTSEQRAGPRSLREPHVLERAEADARDHQVGQHEHDDGDEALADPAVQADVVRDDDHEHEHARRGGDAEARACTCPGFLWPAASSRRDSTLKRASRIAPAHTKSPATKMPQRPKLVRPHL